MSIMLLVSTKATTNIDFSPVIREIGLCPIWSKSGCLRVFSSLTQDSQKRTKAKQTVNMIAHQYSIHGIRHSKLRWLDAEIAGPTLTCKAIAWDRECHAALRQDIVVVLYANRQMHLKGLNQAIHVLLCFHVPALERSTNRSILICLFGMYGFCSFLNWKVWLSRTPSILAV